MASRSTPGASGPRAKAASGREICVVGTDILKNLFAGARRGSGYWVRKSRIAGRPYQIIGVLEPLGSIFGFSRDNVVYIPYSTLPKVLRCATIRLSIFIQVPDCRTSLKRLKIRCARSCAIGAASLHAGDLTTKGSHWKHRTSFSNLYGQGNVEHLSRHDWRSRDLAGGRRYCGDEHHAGFGDRANQRDWHSQSDRRAARKTS